MASFVVPDRASPVEVSTWYGVNESVGETEIKLGESVKQTNFRITKNFKPQKREGYKEFISNSAETSINKAWYGTIDGKDVLIYDTDGDVYEYNFGTEGITIIGSMDTVTDILYFKSLLYFKSATSYKQYDGTTFTDVVGYIPTVEIGGEPDGSGAESFEEINLLTDKVIVERLGDGSSTSFPLLFDVDSVDSVTVDGVSATFTFTSPRTLTITSGTPVDNADVVITCDLNDDQSTTILTNTRLIVFGPNESQLFTWGKDNNTVYYSGLGDATYFPVNSFIYAGTDEKPITDMKPIYDRLIAFKSDSSHYTYVEENSLYEANNGLNKYAYTFYNLNSKYGSLSTAEVIGSTPYTLDGGAIQKWSYQSVVNNVEPTNISDRIRLSLESVDLSSAVTFNYKKLKEYWIAIDGIIYIYN
jgi:hypothetical protein